VFIGLASSTFSHFISNADIETTFTASTAVPHLDVSELLSHVSKQSILSVGNRRISREVDVHPFKIIMVFAINYWVHRDTVTIVNSVLFSVLVYCGCRCVSGVPMKSFVYACQTVCMYNPISGSTRDRGLAVRTSCAPSQPSA